MSTKPDTLSSDLLAWYDQHARDLPWRGKSPDPYRTWVSEIMLQQTRVDTVLRYYDRFLDAFQDVRALAAASDDALLVQWEGLGYYRRARNLRNGARLVVQQWLDGEGRWPQSVEEWLTIPGVGRYTAAAIASIVYCEHAAVVDGNVKRVLARLRGLEVEVNTPAGEREVQARADELIPATRSGDHNQAVMELGATVCTPRSPRCGDCPWQASCVALATGRVGELPRLKPKKAVPHKREAVAVVRRPSDGALLIRRRPADGMLGGMWELPGVFVTEGVEPADTLSAALSELLLALSTNDVDKGAIGVDEGAPGVHTGGDELSGETTPGMHTGGMGDDREVRAGMNVGGTVQVGAVVATARHAYSHFTLACSAYAASLNGDFPDPLPEDWAWLVPAHRSRFALHRAHDKLVQQLWSDQGKLSLS